MRSWKIEEQLPFFNLELLLSSIFGPEDWVEDRTEDDDGGMRLFRRWEGFFEDGGFFDVPSPKTKTPSIYDLRGRKDEEPLPIVHLLDLETKEPSPFFFFRAPLDQGPPAPFSYPEIPGHALHEKDLQRQLGVGTLVSNHKRRVAVISRINRL